MSPQAWPEEPVDLSSVMPWWHRAWQRHGANVRIVGAGLLGGFLGATIVSLAYTLAGAS